MAKLERDYKPKLLERIEKRLPGVEIIFGDTRYKQGTPDVVLLYKDRWALLEVKRSPTASKRPNQDYYVDKYNSMSYAAFIHPENEEDILNELEHALKAKRSSCFSEPF